MERVVTVTKQQRGLGKQCTETPGKRKMQPEACDTHTICPTDPPEAPDETTDRADVLGVRFGSDGTALFINDDTPGEWGGGCKIMP